MNSLFYQLIRVAIGTQSNLSRLPSNKEWKVLYEMAHKQSLIGVCFAGLQHLGADADEGFARIGMSEMLYLTWIGMAAQIQQRNKKIDEQCLELQKKLLSDGLKSCLLKGQGVARLYGEELRPLRQSGDIDIWIDASRERVIEYGMQIRPTKVFDQKHMDYLCYEDTVVEAHWIPVKRYNPIWNYKLEKYFESERERQFTNVVDGLCIPTNDFQLIHQLFHVYSHYVYEGVGLRQIMDLYFTQINCAKEYNGFQKVIKLFKNLDLMKYVAATQWVLKEIFLMPADLLLCEPNAQEGQKLLDEILIGGNFGHYNKQNHVKDETFVQRFFRRWGRKFRMIRFDLLGTLLMPFMRVKLEIWMRSVRKKYGV